VSRAGQFYFSDPRDVSALMAAQDAAGFGFRNVLYRGALAGEYRLTELLPHSRIPLKLLRPGNPPTVVVVGDDAGLSAGPHDFPQARRLLAWAQRCMIHATGGEEQHYRLVADAARGARRVLLVETFTAAEPAWLALVEDEQARRLKAGLPLLPTLLVQAPAHMPPHPTVPHPFTPRDAR
jgi:hypothetical protein